MTKKTYTYYDQNSELEKENMQAAGNVQPTPGKDLPPVHQVKKSKPKPKKPLTTPIIAGIVFSVFIILVLLSIVFNNYQQKQIL